MASQNGLVSSLLNGLSNGTNGITHDHTRPLVLSYIPTGSRVHLPVPEKNYVAAEILRDVFTRFLDDNEDAKVALAFDEVDTSADDEEESGNDSKANQAKAQLKKDRQLVLLSLFLRLVSSPAHTSPHKNARAEANISILRAAVNHLVEAFLQPSGIDIHALAFKLDTEQRRIVIRSFFEARTVLEQNGQLNVASGPISKLLTGSQGQAVVHAVFGGQGTNEVYFDELSVSALLCLSRFANSSTESLCSIRSSTYRHPRESYRRLVRFSREKQGHTAVPAFAFTTSMALIPRFSPSYSLPRFLLCIATSDRSDPNLPVHRYCSSTWSVAR